MKNELGNNLLKSEAPPRYIRNTYLTPKDELLVSRLRSYNTLGHKESKADRALTELGLYTIFSSLFCYALLFYITLKVMDGVNANVIERIVIGCLCLLGYVWHNMRMYDRVLDKVQSIDINWRELVILLLMTAVGIMALNNFLDNYAISSIVSMATIRFVFYPTNYYTRKKEYL